MVSIRKNSWIGDRNHFREVIFSLSEYVFRIFTRGREHIDLDSGAHNKKNLATLVDHIVSSRNRLLRPPPILG